MLWWSSQDPQYHVRVVDAESRGGKLDWGLSVHGPQPHWLAALDGGAPKHQLRGFCLFRLRGRRVPRGH